MPAVKRQGIDVLMVMTVVAGVMYAFFYFMEIAILRLPSRPPFPYPVDIAGAVFMIYWGYRLNTTPGVRYGFALVFAIANLFVGTGLFLTAISDLLGPGSWLHRYIH